MDQEERDALVEEGRRAAHADMLRVNLRELGYANVPDGSLIDEREGVVTLLRGLCAEFGDNDWSPELHLRDVIEKHLMNYVRERLMTDRSRDIYVIASAATRFRRRRKGGANLPRPR